MVHTPNLFAALNACVLRAAQHGKPPSFLVGTANERFPQQPNQMVDVASAAVGKNIDPSNFSSDTRIGQTLTSVVEDQRSGWT